YVMHTNTHRHTHTHTYTPLMPLPPPDTAPAQSAPPPPLHLSFFHPSLCWLFFSVLPLIASFSAFCFLSPAHFCLSLSLALYVSRTLSVSHHTETLVSSPTVLHTHDI